MIEKFSFKNPFKNYFDSFTNRRHKKHKKNIFRPFYNTLKNNKSLSIVQNCVQKCQNFHLFSRVFLHFYRCHTAKKKVHHNLLRKNINWFRQKWSITIIFFLHLTLIRIHTLQILLNRNKNLASKRKLFPGLMIIIIEEYF